MTPLRPRWRHALGGLVVGLIIGVSPASAQDDNPWGQNDTAESTEWHLENESIERVVPVRAPQRDHDVVDAVSPPCAEEVLVEIPGPTAESPPSYGSQCVTYYVCGAERIDDVFSGRIAGSDAAGVYGEYLSSVANALAPDVIEAITVEFRDRLSDAIVATELDDPAHAMALPVFYFCRIGTGGPLELDPASGLAPRFGWDTTVEAEYDVAGALVRLRDELEAKLAASAPQLRAIPPLDGAKTFIKFPMWFWLEDPVIEDGVWGLSSGETIRFQARAKLDRVEWAWGEEIMVCRPDEMRAWSDDLHPYRDRPPCHRIVDELGQFTVAARVVYSVEQNVSMRPGIAVPFPDAPWVQSPQGDIAVIESVGPIDVRELLALNVNQELDLDPDD